MDVEPNLFFGQLETKWFWKSKRYGRIWKCSCECGGYCYVKEEALVMGIVKDCGGICDQKVVPNALMESYAYARGETVTPEEMERVLKRVEKYRKRT